MDLGPPDQTDDAYSGPLAQGTFGIRQDYRPSAANLTLDALSGATYWTRERIAASHRYQWSAYAHARRLGGRTGARTVVDIGCGVATKLNHFFADDFEIAGVDQPSAIALCRQRYRRGLYIEEDFEHPTYRLSQLVPKIDLLICSDVIEHMEDPDRLLAYIHRVATRETLVVLTTPERNALLGRDALRPVNPAHIREWAFEEFATYVRGGGFEVLEHRVLLPFRFAVDRMTLKFLRDRLRRRLPMRTNQMLVCRKRPDA